MCGTASPPWYGSKREVGHGFSKSVNHSTIAVRSKEGQVEVKIARFQVLDNWTILSSKGCALDEGQYHPSPTSATNADL